MSSTKRQFKTSDVWFHFTDLGSNNAQCNYCTQILKISNRSTGNLIRHMRAKHFSISLFRSTRSNLKNKSRDTSINIDNNNHQENSKTTALSSVETVKKESDRQQQQPITEFISKNRPISVNKSKEYDQQLIRMIVKEYYPVRIVEDQEFRKFVQMLCPGYNMPSKKNISHSLIPRLFNTTENALKEKLKHVSAVCITTDRWTSFNNEHFITITAHFLDNATNLNSNLISCSSYNERYTAEHLFNLLKETFQKWELDNKVAAVVTDNAANITAAVRLGGWKHVPCFAHTINLIVQSSLNDNKDIKIIIDKVKSIIDFFKRSSSALAELHSMQEEMGLPMLNLKQDVPTRWNSTYDMLSQILQIKNAVISTLAIVNNDLNNISSHEWILLRQVTLILEIFYAVTNEISSEKTTSLSKLIILTKAMQTHICNFLSTESAFIPKKEVHQLLVSLRDQINKRLKFVEESELCVHATILDPRFKKLGFSDSDKYNQAYTSLILEACAVNICKQSTANPSEVEDNPVTTVSNTKSSLYEFLLWEKFDRLVNKSTVSYNPTAAGTKEVDNFLKDPLIDRHDDPFVWWESKKEQYPRLYELVKKRLCIVATSVPSERIFSKTGQIISEKRSRLTSSKICQIIFLNSNLD